MKKPIAGAEIDPWIREKQKALQLGLALRIHAAESGTPPILPPKVEDAISSFDRRLQGKLKVNSNFKDPDTGLEAPWLYNPNAQDGSEDLLIASPSSPAGKRVFLLCNGFAAITTEQRFLRSYGNLKFSP